MFRKSMTKLAVRLATGTAVACLSVPAAYAQDASYSFNIPAQSLGGALREFGRVTNQQIIFSESLVDGKKSKALTGRYTVEGALSRLLAGSELEVRRTSDGMWAVAAPASTQSDMDRPSTEADHVDIVVTGSRIRKDAASTTAPTTVFSDEDLTDRGYTQVGDLLNDATSIKPEFPITLSQGFPAGPGTTYPNLFNLGSGRTLSLVNGRRMVSSDGGLGDRVVDTNVIPSALVRRVEILQGGGAAVYGSDAIAGVVNYVLKDDFDGLEIDMQSSISTYGDDHRPSVSVTGGKNFAGGRGNISGNLSYAKTHALYERDRPWTALGQAEVNNPLNVNGADGLANTMFIFDGRASNLNRNGVIFDYVFQPPFFRTPFQVGGQRYQFSDDGTQVVPFDTGTLYPNTSTASGGDGFDIRERSTLASGVERYSGSLFGHFEIVDNVKLVGEFLYSKQIGNDPFGTQSILRSNTGFTANGGGTVTFNRNNPFLTQSAIDTLTALKPSFGTGSSLYLSRFFDILPSRNRGSERETWRALVGLEGDFNAGDRAFYWSITASRGQTRGYSEVYAPYANHLNNALSAVRLPSGQIVCSINGDAISTNDDPACVPINPFGNTRPSAEAVAYSTVLTGNSFKNIQDDYLATLGGDLVRLPGGTAKFSLAYEHRREFAEFNPYEADQRGIAFNGEPSLPVAAEYNTDELSGELFIPLVGGDFRLPLVKALEINGSYRYVDNSIAGKESVWGAGVRWDTGYGVTFRGSRSRNFRAPSLTQIFSPVRTSTAPIGIDPCDADRLNQGVPSVRLTNCTALFAANPGYGPLASFQDPAENNSFALVATGGNLNLSNEVSNTLTYGILVQPAFIPGLSFNADRIEVDLQNGLIAFSPASFLAQCYDSTDYPNAACDTFTRNAQGYVVTATSTTFNAAVVKYSGEIYNLNYNLPLERVFGRDLGTLNFGIEATHTTLRVSSVSGANNSNFAGTSGDPDWRGRFDVRYTNGPFRLFYQLYYLPSQTRFLNSNVENDPVPVVSANYRHTISMQLEAGKMTFRAGVNNFTNRGPSFPTRDYGDIFGRRFFVGTNIKF